MMKQLILAAVIIIAVLFISGCASQQKTSQTPTQTAPSPTAAEKHFTINPQTPPLVVPTEVENKVGQISDCYFTETQKTITVTSGTRIPARQAQAMFDKLELGNRLGVYRNTVAKDEIVKAYDDGVAAGKSDPEIVADMAAVIESQIAAGTYISNHLVSGAVDISQQGMSATDKSNFENCANSVNGVKRVIDEDDPVHYHLEIATAPAPTPSPKQVTLTVKMSGSGYGEVSGLDRSCDNGCSVNVGAKITLTAKADDDSEFEGWSGDCSGTGECVLTMDKDKSVTARFKLKESPSPTATPTPLPSPSETPTPTPTQTPEEASSGSIDSASCVIERNQYGYVQKTTLSVSGKASGPVGTVLYSSLDPTCSSWSKGQGVTCVRKEGEPSETSWTGTGSWLHFETSYAVSITGVDPNPSISFACQG